MEPETSFKLRCQLHGHQEDVRSLCVGEIGIVTSSRDTTVKIWAEESAAAYSLLHTLTGHSKYVGAVAYAPPGFLVGFPNGAIISGSFDGTVIMWDVGTAAAVHTLKGHQCQVTAIAVLPSGDVASASVDKTIKLWREGKSAGDLLGHDGPVLCLAVTEAGELLSGSGDQTIKKWRGKQCVQTYKGHTDTVRGLCVFPGIGFVSASHDCTVKVWSDSGDVLAELLGHTAIIYSVAATPGGIIASASEDNTVRLWTASGDCLQTIDHPGCVWAVAFTSAGDLVSGCSDAVARVWSAVAERQGDAETTAAYQKLLDDRNSAAAAAAAQPGPGGMDVEGATAATASGLPPGVKVAQAFELAQPGAKDGETKIVREADGSVCAYSWDAGACVWEKIGTVVEAPEPGSLTSSRRWYTGREWDHVFDVEMDSGMKLKLACDDGENPYLVADRFLEQHDLPQEFKEQVVKFVIDNTGSKTDKPNVSDLPITGGFCDPYTGGSSSSADRPPPRAAAAAAGGLGTYDITGGGVDPFTGGSSSRSAAASSSTAAAAGSQIPAQAYLLFDSAPPAGALRKKLLEFNVILDNVEDLGPDALLTDEEAAEGGLLDQLLASLPAAVAGSPSLQLSEEAMTLAGRLLRWPAAQLFPGLDIARCLVLHPAAASAFAAGAGSMATPVLGTLSGALAAAAVSELSPALQTALRLAVNCFKQQAVRSWVLDNRELILDGFAGCCAAGGPGSNKGVRLSMATLLLNYAVAAAAGTPGGASSSSSSGGEGSVQLLSGLEELIGSCPVEEVDSIHRAVLALGTLMVGPGGGVNGELVGLAKDLGLNGQLQRFSGVGGKVSAAVQEWRQSMPRKLRHGHPAVGSSNVQASLSPAYHRDRLSAAVSNKIRISSTELNITASSAYDTDSCSLC